METQGVLEKLEVDAHHYCCAGAVTCQEFARSLLHQEELSYFAASKKQAIGLSIVVRSSVQVFA